MAEHNLNATCQCCGKLFRIAPCRILRGEGKFCSVPCYTIYVSRPKKVSERFWSHVETEPACWLWSGAKDKNGYGKFWSQTTGHIRAHRMSWILEYGDIPKPLFVLHRCDNPACVRPSHLWLGTNRDNMEDMAIKGRSLNGSKNASCKLSREEVAEIRRLYSGRGSTEVELGQQFSITQGNVSHIVTGRTWKHGS